MKPFVPCHIGLQHITREEIIENHTKPLVQQFFSSFTNRKAIAVLDDTRWKLPDEYLQLFQ